MRFQACRTKQVPLLPAASTPASPCWPLACLVPHVLAELCPHRRWPREASRSFWCQPCEHRGHPCTPSPAESRAHRSTLCRLCKVVPPWVSWKNRVGGRVPLQTLPPGHPWGWWDTHVKRSLQAPAAEACLPGHLSASNPAGVLTLEERCLHHLWFYVALSDPAAAGEVSTSTAPPMDHLDIEKLPLASQHSDQQ